MSNPSIRRLLLVLTLGLAFSSAATAFPASGPGFLAHKGLTHLRWLDWVALQVDANFSNARAHRQSSKAGCKAETPCAPVTPKHGCDIDPDGVTHCKP